MSDSGDDEAGALAPIERRLTLRCGRAQAFAAFVADIGQWWPPGFSASGAQLASVVVEPRPGGRVYERDLDGHEFEWGTVRACEPGRQLVLSWTLALDSGAVTEVELAFADADAGCELRFCHRGWRAGQEAVRAKFDHDRGWNVGLAAYRQHAERG
jgi:uncharacterized protein YndB with AHSA1/START domain